MHKANTSAPMSFFRDLASARQLYSLPRNARAETERFALGLLALLFPHFATHPEESSETLAEHAERLQQDLARLLRSFSRHCHRPAHEIAEAFFAELPAVYGDLLLDADAIDLGDPASESLDEVILAYPGFLAVAVYRIAHVFHQLGVGIFPRLLTEYAHQKTGVDIHPGARIGKRFVMDHGTGIVIGATTEIGDNVKVYQGVTLGAAAVAKELASTKRHPTLEDNVVVYSNATILGGNTVIGHDSIIGGNVWLTESVPPGSVVTHRSEVRVRSLDDIGELEFYI